MDSSTDKYQEDRERPTSVQPVAQPVGRIGRWLRTGFRVLLAVAFVSVGTLHFVRPGPFTQIVPPYLPWPLALVYISGFFEVLGGCGILVPRLRRAAGWGLIALLIAVFPANIYMAVNDVHVDGAAIPPLLLWGRLPFQLVFGVWVWWCMHD
jgi:uncharacterized membrane protein